ncbi:acyltransferase [uncultured Aquimarina sp.]|uniref:acyltransferase family protein n=1 Tax=uncultured Aquimarina sp. TaxID=575652 RepID=UPI002622F443|nr:acyltransferase [uncultured Aquimarina sp.]
MEKSGRIYQIDLFRFIAALSVVLYHYMFRGYAADDLSVINYGEIGDHFKYGYLGVDLFFIISGFVITLSIKNSSLIKFIISRITRLYPVYWIGVLLSFIVMISVGGSRYNVDLKQALINLTMFQNYLGVESVDNVYWSLFVEMKFYFLIGLFLILNKFKKINLDYLIVSWLLFSIVYGLFSDLAFIKLMNSIFILYWSSYFIAGMTFYRIFQTGFKIKYAVILITCLFISSFHAIGRIEGLKTHYNTSYSEYTIVCIISLFYLLMFLVSIGKLKTINSSKLIKIGMLTYPLYLIHQNIGYIIFNNLNEYMNKYIILIATVILMIILSYIISNKIEVKINRVLKNKLLNLIGEKREKALF